MSLLKKEDLAALSLLKGQFFFTGSGKLLSSFL